MKETNRKAVQHGIQRFAGCLGGMVNVIVYAKDKAPLTIEDYPFDMVQKYPWIDNCEVKAIEPDMYIQRDGHSSCVIKLDYME